MKVNVSKGTYIIVESVSEGNPECQIVIVVDGERLVKPGLDPEPMEFEEALSVADEMRMIWDLPATNAIVTHGAMLANNKYVYN